MGIDFIYKTAKVNFMGLQFPTKFLENFQGKNTGNLRQMSDCFEFRSIVDFQTFRLKNRQKIQLNQLKRQGKPKK